MLLLLRLEGKSTVPDQIFFASFSFWCLAHRLVDCGHSTKEIMAATSEASRIRKGRYETLHQLRLKYQGMVMKPSRHGFVLASAPRMSPPKSPPASPVGYRRRVQYRSSPQLDRFSNSGGSDRGMSTMYPSKVMSVARSPITDNSSATPRRSPVRQHRNVVCTTAAVTRKFTPIKRKKHPGLYSPKMHSQNTSQFSMLPPKRHPLSPPMTPAYPMRST